MKNIAKIFGIIAVALLAGGMIIGCAQAEDGMGGLTGPQDPLQASPIGGKGPYTVTEAFKTAFIQYYEQLGDATNLIDGLLGGLGLSSASPRYWTPEDWEKAYNIIKSYVNLDGNGDGGNGGGTGGGGNGGGGTGGGGTGGGGGDGFEIPNTWQEFNTLVLGIYNAGPSDPNYTEAYEGISFLAEMLGVTDANPRNWSDATWLQMHTLAKTFEDF
jgi:hypothetical protein